MEENSNVRTLKGADYDKFRTDCGKLLDFIEKELGIEDPKEKANLMLNTLVVQIIAIHDPDPRIMTKLLRRLESLAYVTEKVDIFMRTLVMNFNDFYETDLKFATMMVDQKTEVVGDSNGHG